MKKDSTTVINYEGKTVFVGMDVHKKSYSITCILEKTVIKKATMKASPEALVEFLKKYFPNALIKSAYEAGFCGFPLHRYLVENGIDNIVVHPASIEVSPCVRILVASNEKTIKGAVGDF
jgi:transposase